MVSDQKYVIKDTNEKLDMIWVIGNYFNNPDNYEVDDKYFYTMEKYPKAFSLLDEAVEKKNTLYQWATISLLITKIRQLRSNILLDINKTKIII